MHRRNALQNLALILGGIALTPEMMAASLAKATERHHAALPLDDRLSLLAELAETIIPETDTPGAKAAGVHQFVQVLVNDCMPTNEQDAFWSGLDAAQAACTKMHGKAFEQCSTDQRAAFLRQLESDSKGKPAPNFWQMLKGAVLFGYFSSEIGMTQALEYDPIPGQWIPEMPITPDTKAWAAMF
jgi:hypothetical protein